MAALERFTCLRYSDWETSVAKEGSLMSVDTKGGHPAMDYKEHVRTYNGFIRATVISIVLVALLMIWMLIFLVPH